MASVATLVLFGLPLLGQQPASAFPQPGQSAVFGVGCSPRIDIDYEHDASMQDAVQWTTQTRNWFLDEAEAWETVLNGSPTQLVQIKKVPNAGWNNWADVDVLLFDPLIVYGRAANGFGYCDPTGIDGTEDTDSGYDDDTRDGRVLLDAGLAEARFKIVTTHEVGHVLGTGHTGDEDSFDNGGGKVPIMATCQAPPPATDPREFSQDDYQMLLHRATSNNHATANRGFEEAGTWPDFWGKTAGSWSSITSSSAARSGDRYLQWTPTDIFSYVYQTTNYAAGADTDIDALFAFKIVGSGSGDVRVLIARRGVDYVTPNQTNCSWFTNADQRTRDTVEALYTIFTAPEAYAATTSWKAGSLSDNTVDDTFHAYDFQVRVFSHVQSGGSMSTIGLDDVSLRER